MSSNDMVHRIDEKVEISYRRADRGRQQNARYTSTSPSALMIPPEKLQPSADYSSLLRSKDMGPEGSSVGQALATALKVKLARNNVEKQISARFIYYAARKIEGTALIDSGCDPFKTDLMFC